MWPFGKKNVGQHSRLGLPCSHCGSTNTVVISYHGSDHPDYIKVWRGQRFVTCKCLDCGQNFYATEPKEGLGEQFQADDSIVYDENQLLEAEKELKRQANEDGDHTYKPY